jgi:hypothetical protein
MYQLQEAVIVYLAQLLQLVEEVLTEIIPMAHLPMAALAVAVMAATVVTEGKARQGKVLMGVLRLVAVEDMLAVAVEVAVLLVLTPPVAEHNDLVVTAALA